MRDRLNADVKHYFLTGEIRDIAMYLTGAEEKLSELWQLSRERLLSACKPFERPFAFFHFDLKKSVPEDQKAFLISEDLLNDVEKKLLEKKEGTDEN